MKKIIVIITCLIVVSISCKKQQPVIVVDQLQEAEKELCKIHAIEDEEAKIEFSTRFAQLLQDMPQSMDYPFQELIDSTYLGILTSEDGKIRIYSWDDELGGTMRFYNNVVQIKSGDSIKTAYYPNTMEEVEKNFSNGYYTHLFTIEGKEKIYYLLAYQNIYSSMPECKTQNYVVFAIEDEELIQQKQFFELMYEEENVILSELNGETGDNSNSETESVLYRDTVDVICEYGISEKKVIFSDNTLFIPQCSYNTDDFKKYSIFVFEGDKFRQIENK